LGTDVFEVTDEVPGQSLTLGRVGLPQAGNLTFCLSAAPCKRGTTATVTVQERVSPKAKAATKAGWQKQLTLWLLRCKNVLEGRRPPATDTIPDNVRVAFAARPPVQDMEKAVRVSASALISAPPDRTWQILWDPATSLLIDPHTVAAGQVPGTPSQQVGEMQYFIHRHADGLLHALLAIVDDLDKGRTALVHHTPTREGYFDTYHQVEPDGQGTRLTLANRLLYPTAQQHQQELETAIAAQVSRYKSAIEVMNPG